MFNFLLDLGAGRTSGYPPGFEDGGDGILWLFSYPVDGTTVPDRSGSRDDTIYSGTCAESNGTSSVIYLPDTIQDTQCVEFYCYLPNVTANYLGKFNTSYSVYISSGVVTTTGFVNPVITVDGVETTTITTGYHTINVCGDNVFDFIGATLLKVDTNYAVDGTQLLRFDIYDAEVEALRDSTDELLYDSLGEQLQVPS